MFEDLFRLARGELRDPARRTRSVRNSPSADMANKARGEDHAGGAELFAAAVAAAAITAAGSADAETRPTLRRRLADWLAGPARAKRAVAELTSSDVQEADEIVDAPLQDPGAETPHAPDLVWSDATPFAIGARFVASVGVAVPPADGAAAPKPGSPASVREPETSQAVPQAGFSLLARSIDSTRQGTSAQASPPPATDQRQVDPGASAAQATTQAHLGQSHLSQAHLGHTAEYGLDLGADAGVPVGPVTNANPTHAPTSGPIKADAAIALHLQAPGTTFGNGGTETTTMSLGNDGTGVTVGILSDSFNTSNYATATNGYKDDVAYDQMQGYLPSSVNILYDYSDPTYPGTDEGRGMAQIVHQVAPGSPIAYATAYNNQADMAAHIRALAAVQGTRVIVDDVSYFDDPTYQDGPIAQAIKDVEAQGILYLSSAGNDASNGYEGKFVAGGKFSVTGAYQSPNKTFSYTADALNITSNGTDLSNSLLPVHVTSGTDITLRWASPATNGGTAATSVLGLFITDVNGNVQFGSSYGYDGYGDFQGAGDTPAQDVYVDKTGDYYLRVGLLDGTPAPTDLKITINNNGRTTTITSVSSNTNTGTLSGHAATFGAIATGAVPFYNTPAYNKIIQSESFSSAGPNYFYFDANGNQLASPLASNVALSGVDGIQNSFFGTNYETLTATGDTGYFFFGTSASAPSVAGVAALMFQENAGLTPADARNILQDSATAHPTYAAGTIPMGGSPTPDPQIGGAGLVDGQLAVRFSQLTNNTLTIDATGTVLGTHYNDRLTGDAAANTLTGFGGSDTFAFTAANAASSTPSIITDYDQGGSGVYAAGEADSVDLAAVAGASSAGLVRLDTTAGGTSSQLQIANGSNWTTLASLAGVGLGNGVTAKLGGSNPAITVNTHVAVGTSADLGTAFTQIDAGTATNLRYTVETTADGLTSSQALTLPGGGAATFAVDKGTTTLGGAITGGSGGLTKTGEGVLALTAQGNSFSGATITAGALDLAHSFGGTASIAFEATTSETATLDLDMSAQNIGGTFADSLNDFADNDFLDLKSFANGVVLYSAINSTLTVTSGLSSQVFNLTGMHADTYYAFGDGMGGTIVQDVLCFVTGTRLRVVRGRGIEEVPVEALRVGDLAVLASGEHRPIRWIGHRDVDCAAAPPPHDVRPVRIRAGAFGLDADGEAVPARELQLSPGHPVLVGSGSNEVLVPIMCLINGTSVARKPVDRVTYWHVELEGGHDILLAEGLPAESYLDWGDRPFFGAGAAAYALANPDHVPPGLGARCRPVALDGPLVEAERRRLDAVFYAEMMAMCHWPTLDDPQLGF